MLLKITTCVLICLSANEPKEFSKQLPTSDLNIPTIESPFNIKVETEMPNWDFEEKNSNNQLGSNSSDFFKKIRESTVIISSGDGWGSGAIISPDGLVLTNHHVISEHLFLTRLNGDTPKFDVITCKVNNGRAKKGVTYKAELIASDPSKDLAILKIARPSNIEFKYFHFNNENHMGEKCYVVGSQGGGLAWSVRMGIVSGVYEFPEDITNIVVGASNKPKSIGERLDVEVLLTDCPISSGDSGGPLISDSGELIGLTFASPRNHSLGATGYHISMNQIRSFLSNEFKNNQKPIYEEFIGQGMPFDIWQCGYPMEHGIVATREDFDIDSDNRADFCLWRKFLYSTEDEKWIPLGWIALFDTSDSKNKALTKAAVARQMGSWDLAATLLPKNLWGLSKKSNFKFDIVIMSNQHGLLATGRANDSLNLLQEIRLEGPNDASPTARWILNKKTAKTKAWVYEDNLTLSRIPVTQGTRSTTFAKQYEQFQALWRN